MDFGESLQIKTKHAVDRFNKREAYRLEYLSYQSIISDRWYIRIIKYIIGVSKG